MEILETLKQLEKDFDLHENIVFEFEVGNKEVGNKLEFLNYFFCDSEQDKFLKVKEINSVKDNNYWATSSKIVKLYLDNQNWYRSYDFLEYLQAPELRESLFENLITIRLTELFGFKKKNSLLETIHYFVNYFKVKSQPFSNHINHEFKFHLDQLLEFDKKIIDLQINLQSDDFLYLENFCLIIKNAITNRKKNLTIVQDDILKLNLILENMIKEKEIISELSEIDEKLNQITVSDISSVFEILDIFENNKHNLWYRGESSFDWDIQPKIFRGSLDVKNYNEYQSYLKFRAKYQHYIPNSKEHIEYLTDMQHYGGITRLLDWSENILVSLYFATENKDVDGKLIILLPQVLNSITVPFTPLEKSNPLYENEEFTKIFIKHNLKLYNNYKFFNNVEEVNKIIFEDDQELSKEIYFDYLLNCMNSPIAIYPNQSNERIRRQFGVFTLHGGAYNQVQNITTDFYKPVTLSSINSRFNVDNKFKIMKIIRIPKESKLKIRNQLDQIKINKSYLMPELEHQFNNI